jgi:hypothetical protein
MSKRNGPSSQDPSARAKRALVKAIFARRLKSAKMQMDEVATGVWRGKGVRAEEVKVGLKAEGVTLENSRLTLLLEAEAASPSRG